MVESVRFEWRKESGKDIVSSIFIVYLHASVLCASIVRYVGTLRRHTENCTGGKNKLDVNKLMDYVLVGKQFFISIWSIPSDGLQRSAQNSIEVIEFVQIQMSNEIMFRDFSYWLTSTHIWELHT